MANMEETMEELQPDTAAEETKAEETASEETAKQETQAEDSVENPSDEGVAEEEQQEELSGKDKKEKKKKEKKEKKDKKDEQIEELTDRLKRSMAEFDNYRKRVEKEKSHMYEIGAKDVIEKILPVIDNFERGFAGVTEEEKTNPFVEGMDKVFKQMITCLEEIGVKQIEALEKEFDPNFHNAVMHVEDENVGENIIVEEFQKGYTYKDSVVRHSMVKVAN